jgi:hypothetical protein
MAGVNVRSRFAASVALWVTLVACCGGTTQSDAAGAGGDASGAGGSAGTGGVDGSTGGAGAVGGVAGSGGAAGTAGTVVTSGSGGADSGLAGSGGGLDAGVGAADGETGQVTDAGGITEWECDKATCHTGQVCVTTHPGQYGASPYSSCLELPDVCADLCKCFCSGGFPSGCFTNGSSQVDCVQG